jgi:3-oxoacyl-[acyl-carrier protein] reductase
MAKKLEGKTALVNCGSCGIGAAIAKRLAADGANVAVYTKGADAGKAAVEKTVATFGRLAVLVNNTGTAIPKKFEEATLEELDRVIDITTSAAPSSRRRRR